MTERAEDILSPSQIETWLNCNRKGAFKYMAGLEDPGNEDTDVGKRFHKVLEDWLKEGIAPDENTQEGRMAMVAIGYLPMPKSPGLNVEGEFTFEMHGLKMLGYKDLEHWRDNTFVVHDHKSCGSFKYMKKAEDLRTDVQGITYAQHAFQARPELTELEENWDYTTKGAEPKHKRTHLTVYRDETDEKAKVIADIGKQIIAIKQNHGRTIEDINKLPFDTDTCPKFRGCPYEDVCALTPLQRAQARLRHHTNAKKGSSIMNFAEMKKRLEEKNRTQAAPTTVQESAPSVSSGQTIREKVNAPSVGATGINPPAAAAKGAEVAQAVAHSLEGQDPIAPPAPQTTDEPKRRGRKPGSKNKPKDASEETSSDPGLPEDEAEETTTQTNTFALFINCIPVKSSYVNLTLGEFLAPIHEAIKQEHGAVHWSLIDHGQGKGILADAVKQRLVQEPLSRTTALLVNALDPDANVCLGVLEANARAVVRGV